MRNYSFSTPSLFLTSNSESYGEYFEGDPSDLIGPVTEAVAKAMEVSHADLMVQFLDPHGYSPRLSPSEAEVITDLWKFFQRTVSAVEMTTKGDDKFRHRDAFVYVNVNRGHGVVWSVSLVG
jgi:hypothetical protein